jgi:hypothetical protein
MGKYDFSSFPGISMWSAAVFPFEGSHKFQMFENCILILIAFYFYCHVPWQLNFQTDKKEEEEHCRFHSAGYKGDSAII